MQIDPITEHRIKASANIVEVFRSYGFNLRKQGSGYVTLCPFHNERHPSMQINPAKGICKCFSCGIKAMDAVQFVVEYEKTSYPEALRRLAAISGIYVGSEGARPIPAPKPAPPKPEQKPMDTTDPNVTKATIAHYDLNPLFAFAASLFGADRAEQALRLYNVGTAKFAVNSNQGGRKSVVFWQVDEAGKVRGGKIVAYDEKTGKRIKGNPGIAADKDVNWAHVAARKRGYNLQQCLFGQHLIARPCKRVNIVESEKTAILASLYFGERNGAWVATGGKDVTASKSRIMEAAHLLQGKDVVLYPDADGAQDWKDLCAVLREMGLRCAVSNAMDGQPQGSKCDIADLIVTAIKGSTQASTIVDTAHETQSPAEAIRPRAQGETAEQAQANNAAIMAQALLAIDILHGIYDFKPPTAEQIEILDPGRDPPAFAPF